MIIKMLAFCDGVYRRLYFSTFLNCFNPLAHENKNVTLAAFEKDA